MQRRADTATDGADAPRKIVRPVVSDLDGTREGGLAFCICLLLGMIGAAGVSAAALTSFWVWFALLLAAAGVSVNVQRMVARWGGYEEDGGGYEEDE